MSEKPTIGDVLVTLQLDWDSVMGSGNEQSASFDTNDPENETGQLSVVRTYNSDYDEPVEEWTVHLNGDPMPGMTEPSAVEAKMAAERQLAERFPNYGPTPEPERDPIPFDV